MRWSELLIFAFLKLCAAAAILASAGIVFSLLFETLRFFAVVDVADFLFGLEWSPQIAIREDQTGGSGKFGAVPLIAGTFLISLVAMAVAAPLGLLSAIYLSEFASPRARGVIKPALEVLAGVPTVVYGFFAVVTLGPLLRDVFLAFDLKLAAESALAAGLVMGVMILPFVASFSEDALYAAPRELRAGALALGSTRAEALWGVMIPAAMQGIAASLLLAFSRAVGETMIVVMAAGLSAKLTMNPLEAVTTMTVQIVTLLVGDQEFDDPKTLAAFAIGMLLFIITLILNVVALSVIHRHGSSSRAM